MALARLEDGRPSQVEKEWNFQSNIVLQGVRLIQIQIQIKKNLEFGMSQILQKFWSVRDLNLLQKLPVSKGI